MNLLSNYISFRKVLEKTKKNLDWKSCKTAAIDKEITKKRRGKRGNIEGKARRRSK